MDCRYGGALPPSELPAGVERMVRVLEVPLSVAGRPALYREAGADAASPARS